jgi:hypothetical protein
MLKLLNSCFFTLLFLSAIQLNAQQKSSAKIAVIQASGLPNQDPFMGDYDQTKVHPQMMAHFRKLLMLFGKAGQMGADLVCGPEDMQHIGSYGLYIDVKDPVTGGVLFNSLAVPVPCPLTDEISAIAKKYKMYIIAPIYEASNGKVFNTALFFDRDGNIIGIARLCCPFWKHGLFQQEMIMKYTGPILAMLLLLPAGKWIILK